MTEPDPRVRLVLNAAEAIVATIEHSQRAAPAGEDWSPSVVVAMILAAAWKVPWGWGDPKNAIKPLPIDVQAAYAKLRRGKG